jgi:hypothetical protein
MKQQLIEILKQALQEQPKQDCGCGCGNCGKAVRLNESKQYDAPISEGLRYHIDNKLTLQDTVYRPGSKSHIELIHEARLLWKQGVVNLYGEDKELFETTDLGKFGIYESQVVPLDFPIMIHEEIINEGLVDHAKEELNRAGLFEEDSDYEGLIGKAVYELIEKFSEQGHSGFSAGWVRELFNKLSNYETLTPITSDINEWTDVAEYGAGDSKGTLWQSKRNPCIFSEDGGKSWYHVDDKQIKEGIKLALNKYKLITEEKKQPALGKPKRGGSKKFYVYVKDPKTKRIKKVSFGMAGGGLRAKLNNPKARQAFSKRHNCPQKKDRTKASYWSCRLPRYSKLLGFKTTFSGYW